MAVSCWLRLALLPHPSWPHDLRPAARYMSRLIEEVDQRLIDQVGAFWTRDRSEEMYSLYFWGGFMIHNSKRDHISVV